DADDLPALGKKFSDPGREPADPAAENQRQHLGLALVGALVDVETGRAFGPAGPQITLPSADPDKAQTVEFDLAVMTLPDVPEQHRLAKPVIRHLREGARAGDGA